MCRMLAIAGAVLFIAACHSDRRYVGVGDVSEVDTAAGQVTICHDEIDGLMGAATTRFEVADDEARSALKIGARVRFEVRRSGDQLLIARATALAGGNPGIHDHTPHHGGIVAMAGMLHLEAKASPDGRIQLYLSDVWRRPLPVGDVRGTVTVDLPAGKRTLPLVASGDALEARGSPLDQRTVHVAFALQRADQPVELTFVLPLASSDSGAVGIPVDGCAAPTAAGNADRRPRCVLRFAKPVAALAATPDAARLLVGVVDFGVTAWRLPAGQFAFGFAPPPSIIAVAEPPHADVPTAVAVRPDGREAVIAIEDRLIFYAMDSGAVVRTLNSPGGNVRGVAWSPNGAALLVVAYFNRTASLLDAADGRALKRFPLDGEGTAVAFEPSARNVAVGGDTGAVSVFDVDSGLAVRVVGAGHGPVRELVFAGGRLLALSDDSVFVWKTAGPGLERKIGPAVRAMATDPNRGILATALAEPRIELINLADGARVDSLAWDAAPISSLVWAGKTLVSGDVSGRVALWEVADAPRASASPSGAPTPTRKPDDIADAQLSE